MKLILHSGAITTERIPQTKKNLVKIMVNGFDAEKVDEVLKQARTNGKPLEVEIVQKPEKRSTNANSYAWKLITELAEVLGTGKQEMYEQMLKEYGKSSLYRVPTEAANILIQSADYYDILSQDEQWTDVLVIVGSSKYNTKEMAILIDGIVSDCKDTGIKTLPPEEIERMKAEWGNQ